jgi:division protein CdvB (Snf7/Vps24/ESCRT-III family)
MKPIIAFTLFLLTFSSFSAQAQKSKINQNEAKKIAAEINHSLDKLNTSIDSVNWNALGILLSKTIETVDKNADALTEIARHIDLKKIDANIEKMATQIGTSIDTKKLEKQLNELGSKIEKALPASKK